MNIIKEYEAKALNTLQKNIKPLQHFCIDVLKIAPNANVKVLGREITKYISFIALGLNPQAVDVPTDTVVNEFLNATKKLTDFTICKGKGIYKFLTMYPELITAAVTVYLTSELSRVKNIDEFLAFDGNEQPKGLKGFFANLFGSAKQRAKEELGKEAEKQGLKAADNFLTYLSEETGIGKAEGNGANSGGNIYYTWKYYPGGPLNGETKPKPEPISKNYLEKVWKPAIANGNNIGFNFDIEQKAFPIYFSKIKAGYYKDGNEWAKVVMEDLKKANEKQAVKNLKNTIGNEGTTNPITKVLSFLTGK